MGNSSLADWGKSPCWEVAKQGFFTGKLESSLDSIFKGIRQDSSVLLFFTSK